MVALKIKKRKMTPIQIEYRFQIDADQSDRFIVSLDAATLQTINSVTAEQPVWTDLDVHKCSNCPLDSSIVPKCPAAENMISLVDRFNQLLSYDKTKVVVVTEERIVCSDTTVQRGICSLMGLLMATSGCPLTAFFKPMARFHLPFASTEETIWRATSTYLLAQYFRLQEGGKPDMIFEGLRDFYSQIQTVNMAFAKRLRMACQQDSMVNAIILLDMFAKSMPSAIEESLEEIQYLFAPYLKHAALP